MLYRSGHCDFMYSQLRYMVRQRFTDMNMIFLFVDLGSSKCRAVQNIGNIKGERNTEAQQTKLP